MSKYFFFLCLIFDFIIGWTEVPVDALKASFSIVLFFSSLQQEKHFFFPSVAACFAVAVCFRYFTILGSNVLSAALVEYCY